MKYQINEYVKIKSSNQIKKIVDFEVIGEIKLYYMSDLTAYPESDVSEVGGDDLVPLIESKYFSEESIKQMAKNSMRIFKNYNSQ